jgi:hypothetical protein
MKLSEDSSVDSFEESLKLWEEIVGSPWFKNISGFLLVLTKKDVLQEKIKSNPFKIERSETSDAEETAQAVIRRYADILNAKNPNARFVPVVVNALEEQDMTKFLTELESFQVKSRVVAF